MITQSLHADYCRLTSGTAKFAIWEQAWYRFEKAGFTQDDLRCYIQHLQRENRRMNSAAYSLALHKFLDDEFKYFDSMLSVARAYERNRRKPMTPVQQVKQEWHPTVDPEQALVQPDNVIPIKDALKKAVAGL